MRNSHTNFRLLEPNATSLNSDICLIQVEEEIDYGHIATVTEGCSGSDLKEICKYAKTAAGTLGLSKCNVRHQTLTITIFLRSYCCDDVC